MTIGLPSLHSPHAEKRDLLKLAVPCPLPSHISPAQSPLCSIHRWVRRQEQGSSWWEITQPPRCWTPHTALGLAEQHFLDGVTQLAPYSVHLKSGHADPKHLGKSGTQ